MLRPLLRYALGLPRRPALTAGDAFILVATAAILYAGVRLAIHTPRVIAGPDISLHYSVLPWYAILISPMSRIPQMSIRENPWDSWRCYLDTPV